MPTHAVIELAGERVALLPGHALYWPRAEALIITDTHWGKTATFRAAGLGVPGDPLAADLARLSDMIRQTNPAHLIHLGDLFHAAAGRVAAVLEKVEAWREAHSALAITLIRGNHDQRAGDPPPHWHIASRGEPLAAPPFVFQHHPGTSEAGYVLAGHLHPAVVLRGPGREWLKAACFWFGARGGVLPAFGGFTGTAEIAPAHGDQVFVVADGAIIGPITP
jgi:DNA ligase-associated metallophosphoesterase